MQPTKPSKRLSDFDGSRDNNFNLIRFVAAAAVIFCHSYVLSTGDEFVDPAYLATGWTSGSYAVDVFFVTSGFLIMASLFRRPNARYFVKARLLRIYPALLVAVLFCAFIVGPLNTQLSLSEYFASKQVYYFVLANGMLEPFPIQFTLPGVFQDTPWRGDINGSLWTLPHEIKAYIGTGLFFFVFVFLRKKDKALPIAFFVLTGLFVACFAYRGWAHGGLVQDHYRLYAFFLVGGCYFLLRERIVLSLPLALVLLAVSLPSFYLLKRQPEWEIVWLVWNTAWLFIMPYILFCIAYVPGGAVRSFNKIGDYSYGLYIYAFPIQQIIASKITGVSPTQMTFLAFPSTLVIAMLSWHFIEKPCLKRVRGSRAKPVESGGVHSAAHPS